MNEDLGAHPDNHSLEKQKIGLIIPLKNNGAIRISKI